MVSTLEKLRVAREEDTTPRVLPGPVGFIGTGRVGTALAMLLNARGVEEVMYEAITAGDKDFTALTTRSSKSIGVPAKGLPQ